MNRATSVEFGGLEYWSIGRPARVPSRRTTIHLLPVYDEYLVAYRDRLAVPHTLYSTWGANIRHGLVINGQMAGTWRSISSSTGVKVEVQTRRRVSPGDRRELARAAARYARFLGAPLSLSVT